MYYKNMHAFECNVVSNFKQSAKNFRRFKILGAPKGPKDTFCLYIFQYYKNILAYEGTLSQNLKAFGKIFRSFKILGGSRGLEGHCPSLYFLILKTFLHSNEILSHFCPTLPPIDKEHLDF